MNENVPEPKNDAAQPATVGPSQTAIPPEAAPLRNTQDAIRDTAPPVPAPSPGPNPLAHLSVPFQAVDYAAKGYHLNATVSPDQVVSAAAQLDKEGFALDTITGVDWMAEGQMELIYDYFHPARAMRVVVRARIPRDRPEIPTVSEVFPGANWHERETHDFFGINFIGHPNLTPFLLPEDADYHPLRKDFAG